MRKSTSPHIAAALAVLLLAAMAAPVFASTGTSDAPQPQTGVYEGYAMVILTDPPLADWPGAARTKNGRLDFTAGANGRYRAALGQARNDFKQWLQSTKSPAQVVHEYDTVLNGLAVRLNGATLDSLRGGPGVTLVEPSFTYTMVMDRSPALINAPALWAALGGVNNAGAGMKIGVIDSGIDQTHPFLTDNSLVPPAGFPKFDAGDQQYTSKKVIVAKVYYTGKPGVLHANAAQEHGTHVSGTIAGVNGTDAAAPADGSAPAVNGLTGIAPKAFLGNYNVFPGSITSAASHDIAQAIEDAVQDGMDVINMSLGGGINGYQDQLTVATNRAVDAGVVVAVAAGNAGPGVNTVGSPGQAENAITACATTNSHYFGIHVTTSPGAANSQTFGASTGAFNNYKPPVTATLANWNNPSDTVGAATSACSPVSGTPYSGDIVVLDRGACSFSTKIRNAQAAGAAGVLVVNNAAGDPIAMGQDGTANQPTIPAVMLQVSDRPAIRGAAGQSADADGTTVAEILTSNGNFLASFSSRGPTNLLDIKPDVCAPGVNVYSSVPGNAYALFQGTSMATPHVSGSAALLLQLHPDWTPAQVKSALVDTANRPSVLGTTNPQNRGGGIVNLANAVAATATLAPAVLSFRKIEPQSAQSKTITVTVTNTTGSAVTFNATAALNPGFNGTGTSATVSPASLTLTGGQSATLSVTVSTSQSTPSGQYWGDLTLTPTTGGAVLKAPLWFAVRTTTDAGPLF